MSVLRPPPPADPLRYDPAGVFATGGVPHASLAAVRDRLDQARDQVLAHAARADGPGAFVGQPERLLAAYREARPTSELFALLQAARELREAVDRLVLVGGSGCLAGVRAVVAACCHPLHEHLPRGERGGRPRLAFVDSGLDNDSLQGLLDLLAPAGRPRTDDLLERWGLLVAGPDADPLETPAASRTLLAALRAGLAGDPALVADRLVTIDLPDGRITAPLRAAGGRHHHPVPEGFSGTGSVFTAAGLLPAAIVGVDVVRLLEGAAAITRRFREAPAEDNPVLQHAAVARLAQTALGSAVQQVCCWSPRLEPLGRWYEHVVGGRPGPRPRPQTIVAPRDLSAHGPRSGGDREGVIVTHLMAGEPRRDPVVVPAAPAADATPPAGAVPRGPTLSTLLADVAASTRESAARVGRPAAEILLPRVDEHALGQLLQMLMLSAAVEDELTRAAAAARPGTHDGPVPAQPALR